MASSYPQLENIASKYQTDNVFILGKGPSVDALDPTVIQSGICIGINDAEKILPADIAIFHAPWVMDSLNESGFSCDLYISNQTLPTSVNNLNCPHIKADQYNTDLIVDRFIEEEILIEDVLLITALKVAKVIANYRMRRQKVYLLGFDFDTSHGYSKKLDHDFSGDDSNYQSSIISAQEHYLMVFLHLLRDSNLHIQHVGKKSFSSLTYEELNGRLGSQNQKPVIRSKAKQIKPADIYAEHISKAALPDPTSSVVITAEITTNHFGDLDRLEKMVTAAKRAGADLVKVQKRDVDSFYTKSQLESPFESPFGATFRDYRHSLELDEKGFRFLDDLCKSVGIGWFASVLDQDSYHFLGQFNPRLIKLPSTISKHKALLETVAREFGGDVVISTGLTDQEYEDYILDLFSTTERLYLLQCTSSYPTPPEHCNIGVIRHYRDLSITSRNVVPGYSSHDFGSTASVMAIAAGARMIEKHVKYGDAEWAHFDSVALDLSTDAFDKFVQDVRLAEKFLGNEIKSIQDSEHHKYWPQDSKLA